MGARGPKSAASLAVVPVAADGAEISYLPSRPDPWPGLSDRESQLWTTIVDSLVVDWFDAGNLPLLAAYCKAVVLFEKVSEAAEEADFVVVSENGTEKVNPVFTLQESAAKQMASLAVKLRLSQSAKWSEKKADTNHGKSKAKKLWD
jgi:phage terminase small subunit